MMMIPPLLAGIVAVLIATVVFGLVLRPLWRDARGWIAPLVLLLTTATAVLYWWIGTPAALNQNTRLAVSPRTLDEAVTQLRQALAGHPKQVEGWLLLGRALSSQQKFAEARDAFAHAAALQPDEPEVLVAAAQARMLAANQTLDATAVQLLERALALQPEHQRGRWLLGVAQRQAGRPAQAATTWRPLLDLVDAGTRGSLLQQIDAARRDAGWAPLEATPAHTHRLTVNVSLDPMRATRGDLSGSSSVFVIARVAGTPMPVAVEKHRLDELPLTVTLGDEDSPMPTRRLSALDQVEVLARLSVGANAQRQPGDIETPVAHVTLPTDHSVDLILGR